MTWECLERSVKIKTIKYHELSSDMKTPNPEVVDRSPAEPTTTGPTGEFVEMSFVLSPGVLLTQKAPEIATNSPDMSR